MKRRSLYLTAIGLATVILAFSFIIYELDLMRSSVPSGVLWQRPIENFATALAVDDGKVFMTDEKGNILCFDTKTGESVWNSSIYVGTSGKYSPLGAWLAWEIVISGNQVYVASNYARVSSFDKDNGTLLWTFQILDDAVFEVTPRLALQDDVLFAITNTIYARDAITGEPLWEADSLEVRFDRFIFIPLSGGFLDGEFFYVVGRDLNLPRSESFANMHFYKINAKTQKIVWCSPLAWDGTVINLGTALYNPRVLARTQGRIIIEVIDQGVSTVNQFFCLNSTTGRELWSTDVGSGGGSFTSIVYNDLLIFAKPDGYIYALNMMDGSVAWKTKVETQDLFSINSIFGNPLFGNSLQPSPFQIDAQNQRLFWYFTVKNSLPPNNDTGVLCSLNISDGDVNWIKHLKTGLSGFKWERPIIFNEETDQIFLTKNNGLWIFNASSGELLQTQEQFEHYILAPIVSEDITFVAADLWLFAYA